MPNFYLESKHMKISRKFLKQEDNEQILALPQIKMYYENKEVKMAYFWRKQRS